jgi:hypothetical protein
MLNKINCNLCDILFTRHDSKSRRCEKCRENRKKEARDRANTRYEKKRKLKRDLKLLEKSTQKKSKDI